MTFKTLTLAAAIATVAAGSAAAYPWMDRDDRMMNSSVQVRSGMTDTYAYEAPVVRSWTERDVYGTGYGYGYGSAAPISRGFVYNPSTEAASDQFDRKIMSNTRR